jgi:hypothetical protein
MKKFDRTTRQGMGCGFEPAPNKHLRVMPWQPPLGPKAYSHKPPTTCVGYLMNLPEVMEGIQAHAHWKNGAIVAFCEGKPKEALLQVVLIFEAARNSVDNWRMTPSKDGGGGA